MRPVICMVTDRSRLGSDSSDALVERVGVAARAGVHLIQIREHDLDGRSLCALVARCCDAVQGTSARVVVNDRLDVAWAAGAAGVHLRSDSAPAERIRDVAPRPFLVGQSVHAFDEALRVAAGEQVDYLLFGTVFPTRSKPAVLPSGTVALRDVIARVAVPVLAIGGITVERVGAIARTGAAGIAAIGLFADGPLSALSVAVGAVNDAFDTTSTVS